MHEQDFYTQLESCLGKNTDTLTLLKLHDKDFWKLCYDFADIVRHSLKLSKNEEEMDGVFQFQDIEKVEKVTIDFCYRHQIENVPMLLDVVEKMYPFFLTKNQDGEDNASACKYQKIGELYHFSKIPSNIFKKIKKCPGQAFL